MRLLQKPVPTFVQKTPLEINDGKNKNTAFAT